MSNNKVKYGLKNVYYAVATIDEDNKATYGNPKKWPGAVSLSLDAQGDTTKFRADNMNYWIGQSNNGYEGDFESALIPDSFRQDVLGDIVDGDGATYEDADAKTVYFALLFQFEGDVKARRHVMYKCSATRPSVSGSTTDENIEPQTETLTVTADAIYVTAVDKNVTKAYVDETDTAYANWFSAVHQPTASPVITT
mgnify:FL=1